MNLPKCVRIVSFLCVPIVSLGVTAYSAYAQTRDSASLTATRRVGSPPRLPHRVGEAAKHVEWHFLRNGNDCYVSGRLDKAGVLHEVVMRSHFRYKLRNVHDATLTDGVFPEVCLAKSLAPLAGKPHQWLLEDARYHIYQADGTPLQETPSNAQQPNVLTLLPVKG